MGKGRTNRGRNDLLRLDGAVEVAELAFGDDADPTFVKAVFHSLSEADLDDARPSCETAIQCANEKRCEEMPGQFDNRVIHVRPHDSKDKDGNYPDGHIRQCFRLNKSYLKDVIK